MPTLHKYKEVNMLPADIIQSIRFVFPKIMTKRERMATEIISGTLTKQELLAMTPVEMGLISNKAIELADTLANRAARV